MKYCEHCGATMNDKDKFCRTCGGKSTEMSESIQPSQRNPLRQPINPEPAQSPTGTNPYSKFAGQMNTGEPQQRSSSLGLLWGGIIVMVLLTIVIFVIAIVMRNPGSLTEKSEKSFSGERATREESETRDSNEEVNSDKLPLQNVKADATLETIEGEWHGEFDFTKMEGFQNLPKDQLPPDIEEKIAKILEAPAPMEMYFEADGEWDMDIDVEMGMNLSSSDYDREQYLESPMVIAPLKQGRFKVDYQDVEEIEGESANLRLFFEGVVIEEDGLRIEGQLKLSMEQNNVQIIEEGSFVLYPSTNEE